MKPSSLILSAFALTALLSACGKEAPKTEAPAAPVAVVSPAPAAPVANAEISPGEAVFKKTCAMCHQSGMAGAPILGKKDDWAGRVEQGMDTLLKHATEGYTGQKGMMPAKGGNAALTDAEIKATVEFMVGKVK